jgi:hypothetical protein
MTTERLYLLLTAALTGVVVDSRGDWGSVNLAVEFAKRIDELVNELEIDQDRWSDRGSQADNFTPSCEAAAHDLSVVPGCQ